MSKSTRAILLSLACIAVSLASVGMYREVKILVILVSCVAIIASLVVKHLNK